MTAAKDIEASRVLATLTPDEKRRFLSELMQASFVQANGESMAREASLWSHRRLFPALTDKTYLNYGARGPMPQPALDAIRDEMERYEKVGPFSYEALIECDRSAEALRETLARGLGVHTCAVALTESTTAACNIALWGIDWQPGDHLLISDCEHLSAIAVAQELQRRFGLRMTYFSAASALSAEALTEAFEKAVRPETRLVVVSHVLWNTGVIVPLNALRSIARARSAGRCQILVDGAQAAGLLDVDTEGDFYAFPAGKWFCGPCGVGALIIGDEARRRVSPVFAGWRGALVTEPEGAVRWRNDAARYEAGTPCYALYRGWEAALRVQREWGSAAGRRERAIEIAAVLWKELQHMRDRGDLPDNTLLPPEPPQSGILAVRIPGAASLARQLETEVVYARSIPYPESLRFCTHYLTTHADLRRTIEALGRVMNHTEKGRK